jgi:hypothetical protein
MRHWSGTVMGDGNVDPEEAAIIYDGLGAAAWAWQVRRERTGSVWFVLRSCVQLRKLRSLAHQ